MISALLKLLLLPVTLALSVVHLALRLFTGVVGMMLGHVLLLIILGGGLYLMFRP